MLGTDIHLAKTASLVLSQAHDFTRSVSEFIKHVLKPLKTLYIFLIYTQQKALQTYDSRWIFLFRTNHINAWRETRTVANSAASPHCNSVARRRTQKARYLQRADAGLMFLCTTLGLSFQTLSASQA